MKPDTLDLIVLGGVVLSVAALDFALGHEAKSIESFLTFLIVAGVALPLYGLLTRNRAD